MVRLDLLLYCCLYLAALVGFLPVFSFLDGWVTLLFIGALCGGIFLDRGGRQKYLGPLPGAILGFGFVVVYALQMSRNQVVEPLIHILCLLLAIRLVSEKSPRNILQAFVLATAVLAASSLLSLEMSYLLYLVLMVFLVMYGLVFLSFFKTRADLRATRAEVRQLVKVALLLPVGSLVLMVLLFFILPRTQMPLWDFLNQRSGKSAGLTDQVTPGKIAELSTNGRIAFRAETPSLPSGSLYWRGVVLNALQGQAWVRSERIVAEQLRSRPQQGRTLHIYAGAGADRFLVTLDGTYELHGVRYESRPDGVYLRRSRNDKQTVYQLQVDPAAQRILQGKEGAYLAVPETVSPRLRATAVELASGAGTFAEKAAALDAFFLDRKLSYSAENLPFTEQPAETFLFETRRGYCEYFASSYALLLRLMGIPARLVGGYLGGRYNDFGGYYLVAEDLAHVWVEALDDNGQWRRIDPSMFAINVEQAFQRQRQTGLPLTTLISDTLFHLWSRTVLNFDFAAQFQLLRSAAESFRGAGLPGRQSGKVSWLLPVFGAFAAFFLLFRFRQRNHPHALARRYLRQVACSSGTQSLPAALGLYALADRTGDPLCREFAGIYGSFLYGGQPLTRNRRERLRQIIRELKRRKLSIDVALPDSLGNNIATVRKNSENAQKG